MSELPNLMPALPELMLALSALALLLVGVLNDKKQLTAAIAAMACFVMIFAAALEPAASAGGVAITFNGMFMVDGFATFSKILILLASVLSLAMSVSWLRQEQAERFEFPVLVIFATLGMMMMVSAANMLSLYLGLELQSLSLYVLAAYQRDSSKATEAGLKYFVLGSLASGLALYGISLVYGFAGSTSFESIAHAVEHGAPTGVVVGMVFILAALAFKVSAVPFHMWAPDVYEGAPTPVTAFFGVAPKIAAFSLLVRLMIGPFGEMAHQWQQVVILVSAASMIVGSFAAINQRNIKRLMAYSSIGHVGYALMGLATADQVGIRGVLIYLALYLFMNIGTFAIILAMRQKGRLLEGIDDLAGLSKTHPAMAMWMAVFMFSMAGVPPMAGFWGKFYVFMAAMDKGFLTLAIIGVLTSVVGAFYYLRIIKIMYFDEPVEALDRGVPGGLTIIMGVNGLVILLFTFAPMPLISSAGAAAASLFGG